MRDEETPPGRSRPCTSAELSSSESIVATDFDDRVYRIELGTGKSEEDS
jgi:hypothetical protein